MRRLIAAPHFGQEGELDEDRVGREGNLLDLVFVFTSGVKSIGSELGTSRPRAFKSRAALSRLSNADNNTVSCVDDRTFG